MTRQYPDCFDRPSLRGPDAAVADDPGNPVRLPYGAGIAAMDRRCR